METQINGSSNFFSPNIPISTVPKFNTEGLEKEFQQMVDNMKKINNSLNGVNRIFVDTSKFETDLERLISIIEENPPPQLNTICLPEMPLMTQQGILSEINQLIGTMNNKRTETMEMKRDRLDTIKAIIEAQKTTQPCPLPKPAKK